MKPVTGGQVVNVLDCYGRSPDQIKHPTSAETCMWGKQLATMLAVKRSAGVAPEVNVRKCTSYMPLPSVNRALKPRGDVTRGPKLGHQWSQ